MKVLVACEESQAVCKAFREKGHEAYSCDIIDCSGGHPEWHIMQDVIPLLNGSCEFKTVDGTKHKIDSKWDLIIAHPPCMSTYFRKPDQIVHPYYFAEYQDDENCERKATCLWMRGVKPLTYTIQFEPRVIRYKNGKGTDSPWHINTMKLPPDERAKARSRTFKGLAKAMAEQWGNHPTEKGGV